MYIPLALHPPPLAYLLNFMEELWRALTWLWALSIENNVAPLEENDHT